MVKYVDKPTLKKYETLLLSIKEAERKIVEEYHKMDAGRINQAHQNIHNMKTKAKRWELVLHRQGQLTFGGLK